MKSLKESILDRDLVDDYKVNFTEDDLKYTFSADIGVGENESGEQLLREISYNRNNITQLEAYNLLHQYVEDDKLLRKYGFSFSTPSSTIKFPFNQGGFDLNHMYFSRTLDNSKGFCVVFNPISNLNIRNNQYNVMSNNIFLVCRVARRYGITLNSVEWVCDKKFKDHITQTIRTETRFQFTDSVEDSLKYIEKKYGRF